jgi:hypothetical protein
LIGFLSVEHQLVERKGLFGRKFSCSQRVLSGECEPGSNDALHVHQTFIVDKATTRNEVHSSSKAEQESIGSLTNE